MSYAIVIKHNNFAIVTADTRSTITNTNERGEKTNVYYDDYKKITIVPNTNIVIAATGANNFRGNTLSGFVSSLKSSAYEDVCKEIIEKAQPILYNSTEVFAFHVVTYEKDKFICNAIKLEDKKIEINNITPSIGLINCHLSYAGMEWATKIFGDELLPVHENPEEATKAAYDYMGRILKASSERVNKAENTIGGGIDMVVLSPNEPPVFLPRKMVDLSKAQTA